MDRCCFPLSLASAGGLGPTLVADPCLRLLPPALASGASGLLLGAGGVLRPRVMGVTSILLPAASSSPAEPGARTTGAGVPVSWDSWLVRANDWPNGGPTQTVIVPNCPVWRRTTLGGGLADRLRDYIYLLRVVFLTGERSGSKHMAPEMI